MAAPVLAALCPPERLMRYDLVSEAPQHVQVWPLPPTPLVFLVLPSAAMAPGMAPLPWGCAALLLLGRGLSQGCNPCSAGSCVCLACRGWLKGGGSCVRMEGARGDEMSRTSSPAGERGGEKKGRGHTPSHPSLAPGLALP